MAEPNHARRYLTRARAKANENPVDLKLLCQLNTQEAAEKQKVITVVETGASASSGTAAPAANTTRISKRTTATGMTEEITGVKAAPKRKSTRSGGGMVKKTAASKASAAKLSKKVAFNDDKENAIPPTRQEAAVRQDDDDTDELMSSSMGALSVKPLRVPSTKLRLPSSSRNITSAFDPLPALSPSKARRLPRPMTTEDEEMKDELSGPMFPVHKLATKPKRGGVLVSRSLAGETGATELRRPLDLSASLLTSPARRPPASPFNPTTANTTFSKANAGIPNTFLRPSLASPARRPPSAAMPNLESPTKSNLRLESSVALGMEIPDLSKSGVRSPPKRIKMPSFVMTDESEDELGMNMDNYMLGRSPTRFVKKCVGNGGPARKFSVNTNTNLNLDGTRRRDVSKLLTFSDISNMPPMANLPGADDSIAEALMGHERDAEDVDMGEVGIMSPTAKKSKGPGGSSHVFFDLDPENKQPPTRNLFSSFFGMEPEKNKLFPSATTSQRPEGGIPIDPFLLNLDAPNNFRGVIESPSRRITVPVKLYSVDDMMSEDEDSGNQENQQLSNQLVTSKDNSQRSGISHTSGVLAGAVVFVDVYTSEGADASAAFVEALRGLGAKVIKTWNWNPNFTGGSGEGERKIGITHVVFKDGSPRTLKKLKDTNGVVLCVGVGWVTSCEDEQAWVDESIYPVDLDHVPRGGHRVSWSFFWLRGMLLICSQRRKSMEPKTLAGIPTSSSPSSSDNINLSATPKTPKLVTKRLFFPQTEQLRGREVDSNPLLTQNLLMARRKSMQFAPKIGSPLRRFAALTIE